MNIHLSLDKISGENLSSLKLVFQHQYEIKLQYDEAEPNSKNCKSFPSEIDLYIPFKDTPILYISVKDIDSNQIVGEKNISLDFSNFNLIDCPTKFTKEENNVDLILMIKYKISKLPIIESIRSSMSESFLISINVGFLQTLLEPSFNLIVEIFDSNRLKLASTELSNASFHSVIPISIDSMSRELVLQVKENMNENEKTYNLQLSQVSHAKYFPLKSNEIISLMVQINKFSDRVLLGMVHSSVMREGSLVLDQMTSKPRVSLTPRRKSHLDALTPRSSTIGALVPGSYKEIMYIQDNSEILDSIDEVLNGFEELSLDHTKQSMKNINGIYIFSNSRSEILEVEASPIKKKGRTKKREAQMICLGILKLRPEYLTGPIKLNASLLKVEMDKTAISNPENSLLKAKNLHFSGNLSEISREMFSDSGVISCTLEGNLVPPNSDNNNPNHSCMTIKMYLSLIPSNQADIPVVSNNELQRSFTSEDIVSRLSSLDSVIDQDINEFIGKKGHHEELVKHVLLSNIDEEAPFNVVTTDNADQDELVGLSKLSVPNEAKFSELKSEFNIKSQSSLYSTGVNSKESLLSQEMHSISNQVGFGEMLTPDMIVNQFTQNSKKDSPGKILTYVDVVKNEMIEKDKLIEKLLKEISEKSKALHVCSKDIRSLREEKITFLDKIENLENEIKEKGVQDIHLEKEIKECIQRSFEDPISSVSSKNRKSIDSSNEKLSFWNEFYESNKSKLTEKQFYHIIDEFMKNTNILKTKINELEEKLSNHQTLLTDFEVIQSKYSKLDSIHQDQSKYLNTMATKIQQVETYEKSILLQEQIIANLQNILENKVKNKSKFVFQSNLIEDAHSPSPQNSFNAGKTFAGNAISLRSQSAKGERNLSIQNEDERNSSVNQLEEKLRSTEEENTELKSKAQLLEEQKLALEEKIQSLQISKENESIENDYEGDENNEDDLIEISDKHPSTFKNIKKANLKIDQLLAESISKDYRISALEKQLESSSRDSARELARLRTKLLELELSYSMAKTIQDNTPEDEDMEISNFDPIEPPPSFLSKSPAKSNTNESVPLLPLSKLEEPERELNFSLNHTDSIVDIDKIPTPKEINDENVRSSVDLSDLVQSIPTNDQNPKDHIKTFVIQIFDQPIESLDSTTASLFGVLTACFKYNYYSNRQEHVYQITSIELTNFPSDIIVKDGHFGIVCELRLSIDEKWFLKSEPKNSLSQSLKWDSAHLHTSHDDIEKNILIYDRQLSHENIRLQCIVKKKSILNEHENYFLGSGLVSLV